MLSNDTTLMQIQSGRTVPLNREKFENGEKTTRILYAHLRGKTALHVLEHSFGGSQQVHTKISKALPTRPAMTRVQFLFTLVFPSQQIGTYRKPAGT